MVPAISESLMRYITPFIIWFLPALAFGQEQQVMILGPGSTNFATVRETLKDDISEDFNVNYREVNDKTEYSVFKGYLEEYYTIHNSYPSFIILMNNQTIDHYIQYQKEFQDREFPVAIACMAALVGNYADRIVNGLAVHYEVSMVSGITKVRDKISKEIKKIGVVYRKSIFEDFIRDQQFLLKDKEAVELVTYPIDQSVTGRRLDKALRTLIRKEKVDAIWIVNDNELLDKEELTRVWMARLDRFRGPTFVNVPTLLTEKGGYLGNVGILPDHKELAIQVADLVYDIYDGNHEGTEKTFQPQSSKVWMNVTYGRKYLGLKPEKINQIDHTIKGSR